MTGGGFGRMPVGRTRVSCRPVHTLSLALRGTMPRRTWHGYRRQPDIDTGCQAPRNGNMPRAPAAKRFDPGTKDRAHVPGPTWPTNVRPAAILDGRYSPVTMATS